MRDTNPTDHESGAYYQFLSSMGVDPYSELRKILDTIGTNPYVAETTGFVSHPYLFQAYNIRRSSTCRPWKRRCRKSKS